MRSLGARRAGGIRWHAPYAFTVIRNDIDEPPGDASGRRSYAQLLPHRIGDAHRRDHLLVRILCGRVHTQTEHEASRPDLGQISAGSRLACGHSVRPARMHRCTAAASYWNPFELG